MTELDKIIADKVSHDLKLIPEVHQAWIKGHLITPTLKAFTECEETGKMINLWLVTDHTGKEDSSYRIVYSEKEDMFGLETTLENGIEWFMGFYGTFKESFDAM